MTAIHLSRNRAILATAGVALALLLAALDQTIVSTALPRIVAELQGVDRYAWIATTYLVAATVMTPISGKLGDLFGRKPFLLVGMLGFVAGSWLCGLAQDMNQLIIFRGVQGLFGGILFSSVFTVIADLYPPAQRGRVQGIFGGVFGLASVIGPFLGGFLTDTLSWRWVFYVNIPVAIPAVITVWYGLPFIKSSATWRDIDFAGALTLAAALVPLLIGFSITRDHAWTSPEVLLLLGAGGVMALVFILIESRVAHPLIPLGLFKNSTFSSAVMVRFFGSFGFFGTIIFVPLIFQGILGASATKSGTLLTPMSLGIFVSAFIGGQLITRIPRYRFLGTAGLLIAGFGIFLLSMVGPGSSQLEVTRDIIIVGIGLGVTFPLYNFAVQAAMPREVVGVATSQVQFWQQMGGTVGTAILGSILANRLPVNIRSEFGKVQVPPQLAGRFKPGTGSFDASLFTDPTKQQALLAGIPAALRPAVQQLLNSFDHAYKLALATTLHEMFLIAIVFVAIAAVASLFLHEVPLGRQPEPIVEVEEEEARLPATVAV